MNDRGIRFIVFRYHHHSPHSGYSRLAEYGKSELKGEVIHTTKPLPNSVIRERMVRRLARGTPAYNRLAMAAELKVAWRMLTEREHIYHFLYGEATYHYTSLINNFRSNRLVATFHLPPSGIRQAVQVNWHLQRLSAAVCVGRNQQDYFSQILDPDRVFFVPLGIDTQYFKPPASFETRDPDLCLFVGDNYRDFPTLRGVIELLAYRRPKTRFTVVTSSRSIELVGSHPSVTLCTGVPEPELLNLYRSAALMIMPLHDATANNAILESMACGLPLVITDVGAVHDYVTSECASLILPGDSRRMSDAVLGLLEDPVQRKRMSEQCREQALNFSWPKVVSQLDSVYATVA